MNLLIDANRLSLLRVVALMISGAASAPAWSNDFPTVERVEYVENCMRKHADRSAHEMRFKCSCAIDSIAAQIRYDEFVELLTATLAVTIGGERGAAVRNAPETARMVKTYRAIEDRANSACFIQ